MLRKCLCLVLSLFLVSVGVSLPANAAVIATAEAFAMQDRQERINEIQRELARDDLQKAMVSMGVDPANAQTRVASLSDAELIQLATELDSLPAGGDILALIGAVFVVLLILELTGVTNVFSNL